MPLPKPHYFPAAVAILSSLTFVVTLITALASGHTNAWPYISDAAAKPPESSIFALSINICSVLIACVVYIRFKQVQAQYRVNWVNRKVRAVNKASFVIGLVSAFAFSLAASFQVSSVEVVHLTGALTGFGLGIVYLWLEVEFKQRFPTQRLILVVFSRRFHPSSSLVFVMEESSSFQESFWPFFPLMLLSWRSSLANSVMTRTPFQT